MWALALALLLIIWVTLRKSYATLSLVYWKNLLYKVYLPYRHHHRGTPKEC